MIALGARADDLAAPPDLGAAPGAPTSAQIFGAVKTPHDGAPRAIGGYSAGCLDGAAKLQLKGPGWFVTRPERNRVFGHPLLVALIQTLGKALHAQKLPALPIGDLSQPRGGPAPTGHASHQTGLDVDIGYVAPGGDGKAVSIVDLPKQRLIPRFLATTRKILAAFVADPHVDRVFVNPAIKRAICEAAAADEDKAWLKKLRPWWGHHDHFHVRLACPPDSPACEPQPALADGDGCDQLAWWFHKKSDEERERERKTYQAKVGASPKLPAPCDDVVRD